jgi:hypothetical protein
MTAVLMLHVATQWPGRVRNRRYEQPWNRHEKKATQEGLTELVQK